MIKLLILLAIIILFAVLGIALSNGRKKRMKVFCEFYEFNEKLLLNLKYGKDKPQKIAGNYPYVKKYFNGEDVLKGDDGNFLTEYVASVGGTDSKSQIDYLNDRKLQLQKYKLSSEEDYKKYGGMYIKLCIMAGILIAVLLA